ncbi:MAG: ferredoxin [Oscillospiraceae bacterium]
MNVKVDKEGCISCGICVNTCPDVFEFDDDDKSTVIKEPEEYEEDEVRDAAESCPVSVIHIED